MTTIDVNIDDAKMILAKHGIAKGGKAWRYLADQILSVSDPYVPASGNAGSYLRQSGRVVDDGAAIEYDTPYARYMWYGKVMVDPKYGYAGILNRKTGQWFSRKGVKKIVSDRDINYNGAPRRGKEWVLRAWSDHGTRICKSLESHLNAGDF